MNKVWKTDEIEFIKSHARLYSDEQLTIELNTRFNRSFTKHSVRKQRQRLNVKKVGHRGYFRVQDSLDTEPAV